MLEGVPLIALTGGIASGKSTIAERLRAAGAVIVDADAIVRDVQQPGSPVLADIGSAFGAEVITADGALDRAALGARVFGDDDALAKLNAIVHPAVRRESERRFREAWDEDPAAVIVYDVPLLVEARVDDPWDLVVVAHAASDTRLRRLIDLRGMTESDAAARIAAQVSDAERLAIADVVIDTEGSIAETLRQVDEFWASLRDRLAH